MAKKRVFVSFDFDSDKVLKYFIIGQVHPMLQPLLKPIFAMLVSTVAVFASAQVQARYADAVIPRSEAPAVTPRYAPSVPLRGEAPSVPQRVAPMVTDTSVPPGSSKNWSWQRLPATGASTAGIVGGGMRLTSVECAGVTCRNMDHGSTTGDGWTIEATGGFPTTGSNDITATLANVKTQEILSTRSRGSMSNGSFNDRISTGRLPPGDYAVAYQRTETEKILAAVKFTVARATPAAAEKTPAKNTKNAGSPYVGIWYASADLYQASATGTIELTADGRYIRRTNTGTVTGHYQIHGDEIRFDGQLTAWDGGRASINEAVILFAWRDGNTNLQFRFRKAN